MGHIAIIPEAVPSSQRPFSSKDQKQIAQCMRNIKLLSCALITIGALYIASISVLSWHIVRSERDKQQKVVNNETTKLLESQQTKTTHLTDAAKHHGDVDNETAILLESHQQTLAHLAVTVKHHGDVDNETAKLLEIQEMTISNLTETVRHLEDSIKDLERNHDSDISDVRTFGESVAKVLESLDKAFSNLTDKIQQQEDVNNVMAVLLDSNKNALSHLIETVKQQEEVNNMTAELLDSHRKAFSYLTETVKQQEDVNNETARLLETQEKTIDNLTETLKHQGDYIKEFERKHDAEFGDVRVFAESIGIGDTYVRWGRAECPGDGSERIYSGYIGGSYYDHPGAASNHLCLPNEPQYDKYVSEFETEGRIYGAEYHAKHSETFFDKHLQYHVPPCALCRSPKTSVIMIPARTTCYDGWTTEFVGYLVSGHFNHKAATEYICLDNNATFTDWSDSGTQFGRLLYMVEGNCDHNLKCPPYEHGKELTCVVCSK